MENRYEKCPTPPKDVDAEESQRLGWQKKVVVLQFSQTFSLQPSILEINELKTSMKTHEALFAFSVQVEIVPLLI